MTQGDCVMVVDDDPDIRETIETVLGLQGFHVVTAAGGAEALAMLRAGTRPRVILLDLMMPGMDGTEFRARQLGDPELAGIPVFVLSGDANASDKAAALGAEGLPKPVELQPLIAVVKRYF